MDIDSIPEGPLVVAVRTDIGKNGVGQGQIEIAPSSARGMKAGGMGLVALVLLTISVTPPGPHAIITLPLGFILIYAAWSVWRVRSKLVAIETTCPGCEAAVTLDGGPLAEKMEDQCPECQRPLMLHPGKES